MSPSQAERDSWEDAPLCADCGVDTAPCTHRPGCRHKGRWEWYMVYDAVWRASGVSLYSYLCIGCLERRLGRQLHLGDFPSHIPINEFTDWDTPRLTDRKSRSAILTAKKKEEA